MFNIAIVITPLMNDYDMIYVVIMQITRRSNEVIWTMIFMSITLPNIFLNFTIKFIQLTPRLLSLYGAAIKFHAPDVSPHLIANIITTMMMMMIMIRCAVI